MPLLADDIFKSVTAGLLMSRSFEYPSPAWRSRSAVVSARQSGPISCEMSHPFDASQSVVISPLRASPEIPEKRLLFSGIWLDSQRQSR
jgi:hypothetical protein